MNIAQSLERSVRLFADEPALVLEGEVEGEGEVVAAYLVLQPGADLEPGEVEAFCRERMAAYTVPRHVEITNAIPKSSAGKVLKRMLRETDSGSGA